MYEKFNGLTVTNASTEQFHSMMKMNEVGLMGELAYEVEWIILKLL
jgi:hypothetical protein